MPRLPPRVMLHAGGDPALQSQQLSLRRPHSLRPLACHSEAAPLESSRQGRSPRGGAVTLSPHPRALSTRAPLCCNLRAARGGPGVGVAGAGSGRCDAPPLRAVTQVRKHGGRRTGRRAVQPKVGPGPEIARHRRDPDPQQAAAGVRQEAEAGHWQ